MKTTSGISLNNAAVAATPKHLLQFAVDQRYDDYTSVDHAVWRFIMRQNVFFLREFRGRKLHHVHDDGGKAVLAGFLGSELREAFGAAGLRTEKNGERPERFFGGRSRRLGDGVDRAARKQAGDKAVEPRTLLRCERGAFGNDGNGLHGLSGC